MSDSLLEKLEAALVDTSDVYVNKSSDAQIYFSVLASYIREHTCIPFQLSVTVMPSGFTDYSVGSKISGQCVARNCGCWLVYHRDQDQLYYFWGSDKSNLGAHGVTGSPLYRWSA